MANNKPEFLETMFDQIESQVQFGDNKASFLLAGDAILLAISGGLIRMVSDCRGDDFVMSCMVPSGTLGVVTLGLATISSALLTASLTCALLAARPAKIHDHPPSELFLLSYVARMERDAFTKRYLDASPSELVREALNSIHGKCVYAVRKFRWLRKAIDLTLLSIGFMVAALTTAIIGRFLT